VLKSSVDLTMDSKNRADNLSSELKV